MGVKISELLDLPKEIELRPGVSFKVHALELASVGRLIVEYRGAFGALYEMAQGGKPDWASFVVEAPDMVADIIATAADVTEPEEKQAVRRLPATVQLEALAEIWGLTVPQPKKLQELLSMVSAGMKGAVSVKRTMSESPANPAETISSDASSTTLPSQSDTSAATATD